jgi:hypothetical protein
MRSGGAPPPPGAPPRAGVFDEVGQQARVLGVQLTVAPDPGHRGGRAGPDQYPELVPWSHGEPTTPLVGLGHHDGHRNAEAAQRRVGMVVPQQAEQSQVILAPEAGTHGAVGVPVQVGQRAGQGVVGPVGVHGAQHPGRAGPVGPLRHGRGQGHLAGGPVGEATGELGGSAVDQDQGLGQPGVSGGHLDGQVGPQMMAGQHRPAGVARPGP